MEPIDAINDLDLQTQNVQQTATDGFGLAFEDLLNIVLTQ